jgi:hypothetical protein
MRFSKDFAAETSTRAGGGGTRGERKQEKRSLNELRLWLLLTGLSSSLYALSLDSTSITFTSHRSPLSPTRGGQPGDHERPSPASPTRLDRTRTLWEH